ncbi:MAG TPA: peptide chain release factor N(5)-glutamine methyltransferase [Candidatus Limnocylindrales bacterium]|nr:peptide chain release factor N(5)-glutamine methyltransferase [Candidatus Limnocylindrales bacterium]
MKRLRRNLPLRKIVRSLAVTVLELIQRTTEFLTKKGVDSPRLQAELLLAHVLGVARMQLYLNFEKQLTPPQVDQFRESVRRRGAREPLQHILGTVSFCGFEIVVNRHVLVPRPETELLAELGWEFLNRCTTPAPKVLDFGTGSGCLAIVLAAKCSRGQVHALDVSPEALEVARQNARHNQVAERMQFWLGNNLAALPKNLSFDLIVSNPPYIPTTEIDRLQPEVRDFDPRIALDGGRDGLNYFRQLANESGPKLMTGGRLIVEFGDHQAGLLRALFESQNWIVERIVEDYNRSPRIMIVVKNTEAAGA